MFLSVRVFDRNMSNIVDMSVISWKNIYCHVSSMRVSVGIILDGWLIVVFMFCYTFCSGAIHLVHTHRRGRLSAMRMSMYCCHIVTYVIIISYRVGGLV